MFLSTGCSLLRSEGFSCSLGVLYGGLGISKLQFLIKKIEIKFPAINFFSILGHQTLDPDPGSGPGIQIRSGGLHPQVPQGLCVPPLCPSGGGVL
jgi:hypothetical protein